jgi:hypothetical protein
MALSEVMEGSTHNSNDSAGLAMNGSSRADKNMAYDFKEVNESNRRVSASSSDGGGGSSRDQSPNRRGGSRGRQSAPGYGYWDNVRYHHDGMTDKDVAIAIPESNGTDGSRGSSGMKSERLSAGSVLDPFGDAQREDEAAR